MSLFYKHLFHEVLYALHVGSFILIFFLGKGHYLVGKLAGKMLVVAAAGHSRLKNSLGYFNFIKGFYSSVSLGNVGKHFHFLLLYELLKCAVIIQHTIYGVKHFFAYKIYYF